MLHLANQGQKIVSTNFWDTEMARRGYAYLSWNAGAARLLLPGALGPAVREMKSAKYVIVSRGRWAEAGRDDEGGRVGQGGADDRTEERALSA